MFSVLGEKQQWKLEGISLAKEYTAIENIEKVSLYHGKESYLVVQGTNAAQIPMIAWFREGQFEGFEYEKDIASAEQIEKLIQAQVKVKEWVRIQPGMENQRPLWEVVVIDEENKFNYYYYDMKSAQFIRSYKLQKTAG